MDCRAALAVTKYCARSDGNTSLAVTNPLKPITQVGKNDGVSLGYEAHIYRDGGVQF